MSTASVLTPPRKPISTHSHPSWSGPSSSRTQDSPTIVPSRSPPTLISSSSYNAIHSSPPSQPADPYKQRPTGCSTLRRRARLRCCDRTTVRWMMLFCLFVISWTFWHHPARQDSFHHLPAEWREDSHMVQILKPQRMERDQTEKQDPEKWLKENSHNAFAVGKAGHMSNRPRAALISLVRNEELEGILQSMRQLEYHWNRKYQYPWIFFNEKPFSNEFKVRGTLTRDFARLMRNRLQHPMRLPRQLSTG